MVAAAIIGGAVVAGAATGVAGSESAGATKSAAATAANEQQSAINQSAQLSAPYRGLGTTALPQYEACHASAKKAMVDFHMEDMAVCKAVQRGYYGSGFRTGRMSYLEMPIWLFHRYLAARTRHTRPTVDRPAASSQFGRVGPVPA